MFHLEDVLVPDRLMVETIWLFVNLDRFTREEDQVSGWQLSAQKPRFGTVLIYQKGP